MNELVVLSIFLLASLLHGVVGFSFALVATPLLAMILPVQEAILLTIIPTIWANLFSTLSVEKATGQLWEYLPMFFSIAVGSVFGTYLLFVIPATLFNLFLVAIIWLYLYIDYRKSSLHFNFSSRRWQYPVGLLAGISAGICNIMSPILLVYFLSIRKGRNEIILLSNFSFLTAKVVQLIIFSKERTLGEGYISMTLLILAVSTVGLLLGRRVREHTLISDNYTKIVKGFIFVISLVLLKRIIW